MRGCKILEPEGAIPQRYATVYDHFVVVDDYFSLFRLYRKHFRTLYHDT